MEIIEHKIGDTFYLEDGTKLEVVKATCNCKDCYFFNSKNNICSRTKDIICSAPRRKDKEFVIFIQIKNNNMEEKRNIQISLEEAREWYNSVDQFKRDLALRVYNKEELELSYIKILHKLPDDITRKTALKSDMYLKLINVAEYLYKKYEPVVINNHYLYYLIVPKLSIPSSTKYTDYKDFSIKATSVKPYDNVYFNSIKAAKEAIDILGNKLKILFE